MGLLVTLPLMRWRTPCSINSKIGFMGWWLFFFFSLNGQSWRRDLLPNLKAMKHGMLRKGQEKGGGWRHPICTSWYEATEGATRHEMVWDGWGSQHVRADVRWLGKPPGMRWCKKPVMQQPASFTQGAQDRCLLSPITWSCIVQSNGRYNLMATFPQIFKQSTYLLNPNMVHVLEHIWFLKSGKANKRGKGQ